MNILSWISGILRPAKDLTEVFVENREGRARRKHEASMADAELNTAVLDQFSREFSDRSSRTWWDSLVDGLNRLPRPLITLSLVGFFAAAPFFPERIIQVSRAYEVIPPGFWALLSIVIGFYFGGRMQLKSQDFRIKGSALQAAKELTQIREEFRSFVMDDEPPEETSYKRALADHNGRPPNRTAQAWRQRRAGGEAAVDSGRGPKPAARDRDPLAGFEDMTG